MNPPEVIDVPTQRRRLALMLAINLVCLLIGAAAAVGLFAYHLAGLAVVFVAALVVGFAAHVWLMLGLAQGARPKGSV